jgi:hypothetical protein
MSLKKCSKCSASFECCNEQPGCWCETVFLDLPTLKQLKQEFDNCLCPQCLKPYSIEKAG